MKGRLMMGAAVLLMVSGCATPRPSGLDPEVKALAESALAAMQRGEVERADALYVKALQRARLTDSRDEIIRNAYNLALCRMTAGRVPEARSLLIQARVLTGDRGAQAALVMLADAEALRMAGSPAESDLLARQARDAGVDDAGRVQSWVLQGEAAHASGRLQDLARCLHKADAASGATTPPALLARKEALRIELIKAKLLEGNLAECQLDRAGHLRKAGQFKDMVAALTAAAAVFEQEGKSAEAFDCRIRAAQSLMADGNLAQARLEAKAAEELAGRTGNAGHKTLAGGLLHDLQ